MAGRLEYYGVGGIPAPKGVAFNAPPVSLMSDAGRVIESVTSQLPTDVNGAILALETANGWNAAVVHRVGKDFAVAAWIGKNWDGGVTGGAVRAVW